MSYSTAFLFVKHTNCVGNRSSLAFLCRSLVTSGLERYLLFTTSNQNLCFKIHSFYRPKRRFENSYVSGPGTTPLLGVTIGQLLEKTAGRYGDDDAVVVVHQKIRKTYQQLLREVI